MPRPKNLGLPLPLFAADALLLNSLRLATTPKGKIIRRGLHEMRMGLNKLAVMLRPKRGNQT